MYTSKFWTIEYQFLGGKKWAGIRPVPLFNASITTADSPLLRLRVLALLLLSKLLLVLSLL